MMTSPDAQTLRHIARWLTRLAVVTRQPADNPVTASTLDDYANILARDLPSSAFTTAPLHFVVAGEEWFPPVARIEKRVSEWWKKHRPPLAALTAPAGSPDDDRSSWSEDDEL